MALTAVLLAGGVVSGYTRSEIVDSRAFSSRTASALDDRAVREAALRAAEPEHGVGHAAIRLRP